MKAAAAVAPKATVLAVTSGKGGVGKTFFSANLAAALARLGERVRAHVGAHPIPIGAAEEVTVTVSIGGAFAPQWVRSSPLLWVERADQQLYRAKSEGRNRACLEEPMVSHVSAEEKGLLFGTSTFAELG